MSMLAKIVVVLGLSSLVSSSGDQCNGMNVMGLMTWSEGVCRNERSCNGTTSNMIVCNKNETDSGEFWFWDHADCTGAVMHVQSVNDLFPVGLVEMVCDGVDCPYAMIRSYELDGDMNSYDDMSTTDDMMSSAEDMSTTDDMMSTTLTSTSTTDTMNNIERRLNEYMSTTDDMWSTYEYMSTTEFWNMSCEDFDFEFEAWQENAVALTDCFHPYNETALYMGHVCQDGNVTMEYYNNSDCSGPALHTQQHFALEGICPQVDCYSGITDEPTTTTDSDYTPLADNEDSSEDDVRPTDHLVAIGFALITVVVGSV